MTFPAPRPPHPPLSTRGRLGEIASAFLKLGCLSFGGPVAHLGYLRNEFVTRRGWLDDNAYADMVGLCQFLPGPTSSQVVFALGMLRAGVGGAILSSCCFTLPSALLMIAFGYSVSRIHDLAHAGWLHGLRLAAVAVVAQAVWGMSKKLCPDFLRIIFAVLAATFVLYWPTPFTQLWVIGVSALVGYIVYKDSRPTTEVARARVFHRGHGWALATLMLFFVLLLGLPQLARTGVRNWQLFDSFYRSGSLVFGGGHVVLPLLRAEMVPHGWISDDSFLAGYGAAQALPGPLFTFSAYLGTVIHGGPQAWRGGLLCLGAIFLPTWLLVGGGWPFWDLIRQKSGIQAALRGVNAAVVGILLAALYNPISIETIHTLGDVAAAFLGLLLLEKWAVKSWQVVLLLCAAGQWLL